jgi:hypothetical protein
MTENIVGQSPKRADEQDSTLMSNVFDYLRALHVGSASISESIRLSSWMDISRLNKQLSV